MKTKLTKTEKAVQIVKLKGQLEQLALEWMALRGSKIEFIRELGINYPQQYYAVMSGAAAISVNRLQGYVDKAAELVENARGGK